MQLPIYLLAARALFPEVEQWQALLDFCTVRGGYRQVRLSSGQTSHSDEPSELARLLDSFVAGMEKGEYFYVPGAHCRFCEFREVCGAGHEVAHARKQSDPRYKRFLEGKQP